MPRLVRDFLVGDEVPAGQRLDSYLGERLSGFTRSQLKARVTTVRVNEASAKLSRRLLPGDRIRVEIDQPESPAYGPEAVDLAVLYEDEEVIVIDKQPGLVVHPGAGVAHGTLAQGLLHRFNGLRDEFAREALRPGIVHRLDRDTSGVLIAAKNAAAHEALASEFRAHRVRKVYLAVVEGRPPASTGIIDANIRRDPVHRKRFTVAASGGRTASTRYRVLAVSESRAFVRLEPKTGRTHQLRVHMKSLGCPIVGDRVYGSGRGGLLLHAYLLEVLLPSGLRPVFRAPLPERFKVELGSWRTGRG